MSAIASDKSASLPTVRRLPGYLSLLRQFQQRGRDLASSESIARSLSLEPIQVRKDFAMAGVTGRPRLGYEVAEAICTIECFLGWDNTTDAFLVGVGNLGRALLGYDGFARHGLSIVAAFDNDPGKVGTEVHGKRVLPLSKLADLARRLHVTMGVLTVPASAAADGASLLVSAGIRAISNFTSVALQVPDDVVVQNEDLAQGLAVLSVKARELQQS